MPVILALQDSWQIVIIALESWIVRAWLSALAVRILLAEAILAISSDRYLIIHA